MPICLYWVVVLKNTSGAVRQGSSAGPFFFNCFIHDIELCLKAMKLYLLTDDGKAVGEISSNNGTVDIQADLDAIAEWSEVNQLPLSLPKCCCIHYGKKNPNHKYTIGSQEMISSVEHEDLSILRTADFVYSKHVAQLALKVNKLSGMMFKAFESRSWPFMQTLWQHHLRPKLECASQVWNTALGCAAIERVQRRYTKRMSGLRHVEYEERLERLELPSLSTRRDKVDLIFIHKLLNGKFDINTTEFDIQKTAGVTRDNGCNIVVKRPFTSTIAKSFTHRIASQWNSLPLTAKKTVSLNTFKTLIA